jgi:hypothetical protein
MIGVPLGTADSTMPVVIGQSRSMTVPGVALLGSTKIVFAAPAMSRVAQSLSVNTPLVPPLMMMILARRPGVALTTQAVVKLNADNVPPLETIKLSLSGSTIGGAGGARRRYWITAIGKPRVRRARYRDED